ncbi:MAG: NAD-dependent epimerase/dehydratase family protein [Candidatus Helarchaeota archaeon]
MKKILVTGGLGYIGSVLCEELRKVGIEALIVDNNLYNLAGTDTIFINVDLRNKDKLERILKKHSSELSAIIHLAGIVGDPACLIDTKKAIMINCVGTRNVVELANKFNLKIFHASTCSLYGAEHCTLESPLTEEAHLFPIDFYGQTKYQQERFVLELADKFCIFRLATAYGLSPRMRYDLVLNLFAAKAARDETLTVFGGTQYRPFTHVRDIASAFIHAIQENLEGIYNIVAINETIINIATLINELFNTEIEITDLIHDPRNYIADNKKILNTGFTFKWTLQEGLNEVIEYSKKIDYTQTRFSNQKLMQLLRIDESKILITGGTGRLGTACKKIMPNAQYPKRTELDLQNLESIKNYFNTHIINTVIHLAAMTGVVECDNNKAKAFDTNVNGTRRLIETAFKSGSVKHFILVSTACVFPGTDMNAMEDEDSIPEPKNYYSLTKLLQEEIVKSYDSPQMKVTIVRTNFSSMPWPYPKAFTDRYGTYLFPQGVAKGLKDIVIYKPENTIIHICGDRKISMYEYAKAGGSEVGPLTLDEYNGPPLTCNMSLTTKYWKHYKLEDSDAD